MSSTYKILWFEDRVPITNHIEPFADAELTLVVARTPAQFEELLAGDTFHLLMLDLNIPEYDVLEYIQKRANLSKNTPIAIVSAMDSSDEWKPGIRKLRSIYHNVFKIPKPLPPPQQQALYKSIITDRIRDEIDNATHERPSIQHDFDPSNLRTLSLTDYMRLAAC